MEVTKQHLLQNDFKNLMKSNAGYALLIFQGDKGKQDLKDFFQVINHQPNNKGIWIENPKNEICFWKEILKEMGVTKIQEKKYSSPCVIEEDAIAKLKDKKIKTHLFIPSLEKIFYDFDKQTHSLKIPKFNTRLRASWYQCKGLLNICASVENENSNAYKSTLGNRYFPFYINNFCVREIKD